MPNNRLIAHISAKESLSGKLNNPIEKIYPELEDLEVTPSGEEQKFKSNKYGFDNVTVKAVESEELNIMPSTEEQVSEGLYDKVTVAGDSNLVAGNIKQGTSIFGVEGIAELKGEENAIVDGEALPTFSSTMSYSPVILLIKKLPPLNTSSWTSGYGMFNAFKALEEVPEIDTSNMTNMSDFYSQCSLLKKIPEMNTSQNKNFSNFYYYCTSLEEVPQIDTGNGTDFARMYYNCPKLQTIPQINVGKANDINNIIGNCTELVNFGGLKDLGKGYTRTTANYNSYGLDVRSCPNLSHDSLMNIINGLYDLNLTYDVANGGTLYAQSLKLGSTNLAKLTAEEIAIGTAKGWNIS